MSYEKFIEEVLNILRSRTGESLKLSICTVVKNNGYKRKGITFSQERGGASLNIYLEEYYEEYGREGEIEKIAGQILEEFNKERDRYRQVTAKDVLDYKNAKDRIIYKLVNREKNKELLLQAPHVEYLDFAVLFYVLVDVEGDKNTTMMIRNEHLNFWNVEEEEIRRRAEDNTKNLLPYEFMPIYEIIGKILGDADVGDEDMKKFDDRENMYILTNHVRSGGAAAILYPGRLEAIGEYFKENFYILPSSIDEVIIIPESRALPVEEMEGIIQEVNGTELLPEEFLSDHAYYYDRMKKEVAEA